MHRRQRGLASARPCAVVEADDSDVLGHAPSELAERLECAGRDGVGCGEHAVDVGRALQQRAHGGRPLSVRVVRDRFDEGRVESVAEGLAEAGETIHAGVTVECGGDHRDARTARGEQALADRPCGAVIVDADPRGSDAPRVPDERGGQVEPFDGAGDRVVLPRRDDHGSVGEAALEVPGDACGVLRGVDDEAHHLVIGI